jgi:hypothetical protein
MYQIQNYHKQVLFTNDAVRLKSSFGNRYTAYRFNSQLIRQQTKRSLSKSRDCRQHGLGTGSHDTGTVGNLYIWIGNSGLRRHGFRKFRFRSNHTGELSSDLVNYVNRNVTVLVFRIPGTDLRNDHTSKPTMSNWWSRTTHQSGGEMTLLKKKKSSLLFSRDSRILPLIVCVAMFFGPVCAATTQVQIVK